MSVKDNKKGEQRESIEIGKQEGESGSTTPKSGQQQLRGVLSSTSLQKTGEQRSLKKKVTFSDIPQTQTVS